MTGTAADTQAEYDWRQQYEERAKHLDDNGIFGAADDIRTLVDGIVGLERDLAALAARLQTAERAWDHAANRAERMEARAVAAERERDEALADKQAWVDLSVEADVAAGKSAIRAVAAEKERDALLAEKDQWQLDIDAQEFRLEAATDALRVAEISLRTFAMNRWEGEEVTLAYSTDSEEYKRYGPLRLVNAAQYAQEALERIAARAVLAGEDGQA